MGDVGRVLDVVQRLSPGLVDLALSLVAFPLQKTTEPKSENDPNNLYEPVSEDNRVKGDFGHLVIPSVTDWIDKNPLLKWGTVAGALIGVSAMAIAAQVFNQDRGA